MKWIRIALYILTYGILIYSGHNLIVNSAESILNLFGHIQAPQELHKIISVIIEVLTIGVITILFFIPVGGDREGMNLTYFIDKLDRYIKQLINNADQSKEVKNKSLLDLIHSFIVYTAIMIAYVLLLSYLGNIENGLKLLLALVLTYILISGVDFMTKIIVKLDQAEQDGRAEGYESKKTFIVWIVIILIFVSLRGGLYLVDKVYDISHEAPVIQWFDGDRLHVNQ